MRPQLWVIAGPIDIPPPPSHFVTQEEDSH